MINSEIYPLLNALSRLEVIRISVDFKPRRDLDQKAWVGAAVRNRFLYAAEQIKMPEGDSLRERLDRLWLKEEHFLYKQLCGGFPKGYLLDVSELPFNGNEFCMTTSERYRISILLMGRLVELQPYVISAVNVMLESGLGQPCVPLDLMCLSVSQPFCLSDFDELTFDCDTEVRLCLKTPVALTRPTDDYSSGYQSRLNGFPSFYQWMSAVTYRLSTLAVLYAENGLQDIRTKGEWETCMESFIAQSVRSWLTNADIEYVSLRSTPKRGVNNVYVMSGYVGTITYSRVLPEYIPLLRMMSELSIGNDVNFGLGKYRCLFLEVNRY